MKLKFILFTLVFGNSYLILGETITKQELITAIPFKELLLAVLGILSSVLIIRIQYQKNRIHEIERQLSSKKFELYSEFIYLIFDIINEQKLNQQVDVEQKLISIKKNMFLYSSDSIFFAFNDWLNSLNDPNQFGEGKTTHFIKYYKVIQLIRKEMVDKKTKVSLDDFMIFLMQNKKEYERFKAINNWN